MNRPNSRQHTLMHRVSARGVGLHTGVPMDLTLRPAVEGTGIVFRRTDLPLAVELPARLDSVVDTRMATVLGKGDVTLSTVEHLMAALWAAGVDNAVVDVSGPEVPVMDGSALAWVKLLEDAGVRAQVAPRRVARVIKQVTVTQGDKHASVGPGVGFGVSCAIEFKHPLITRQVFSGLVDGARFQKELAFARTFGFSREVEALQKMGLARGGSMANAVVVDEHTILNPEGLRSPDEFVRHKVLDAIGDLYLLGAHMVAQVDLFKAGHALHVALGRALLARPDALEWVTAQDLADAPRDVPRYPSLRPQAAAMGSMGAVAG